MEEDVVGTSSSNDEDDAILYDVSPQLEWPVEKEILGGHDENQSGAAYASAKYLSTSASRWMWGTAKAIGFPIKTSGACSLPEDLIQLITGGASWHIVRSPDGNFIAVLQNGCLEIRSQRDEYNTLIGRCTFSKDPNPQWRKVAWSQHSTTVAFSDSNGTVHVCDIRGILLFSFAGHLADEEDFFDHSAAISSLVFIGNEVVQKHKEDSLHLLVTSYSGSASCLEINPAHQDSYKTLFQFDFSASHSNGVSQVLYNRDHSMVIVGGCTGHALDDISVPKATRYGITVWRLLAEEPFLKSVDVFLDRSLFNAKPGLFRRLSTVPSNLTKRFQKRVTDCVYTMTLSPCHKFLASIHLSGALSWWEIPSFRLKRTWTKLEQPFHDEEETDESKSSSKQTERPTVLENTVDCKWWNESALVLVRYTGSLTVVKLTGNSLENLFGGQCEWLEPAPRITFCRDEGFLALECKVDIRSLKRQREDSGDSQKEDEDEHDPFLDNNDDEESSTLVQKWKNFTKSAVYQLTEMERFRPPHKRPKLSTKLFKLTSITQTTPEKLFEKRLEDEEYGEALALAQRYNLDGDRVFQRQWRKSPVSHASIQDYLSKVKKLSWVLHECCERVPEELDTARELLKFALRVTDMDKIAGGDSMSRSSDSDSDFEEYDGFDVEEQRRQEILHRSKFISKWSEQIDFTNLTLQQKEMIRTRKKIFQYLDRLSTYEYLLGGYDAAREHYNCEKYAAFRQQDIVVSAFHFARECDWKAVDTLLTFHGSDLREHRLAILSNFPKTLPPSEYKSLLPVVNEDGTVGGWPEVIHRDPEDWSEMREFTHALTPLTQPMDPSDEFYQEDPALEKFRTSTLTPDIVKNWFSHQAVHIDQDACDIESTLAFLKIGADNYVEGLDDLIRDFKTLEVLIYECDYDPGLTLSKLREKSELQQLKMLLEKSSKEMYIKNFHRWAIPFLRSYDKIQPARDVFQKYVLEMAEDDLAFPALLFASFLQDKSMPKEICTLEGMIKLALDSIYLNSVPDQLMYVQQIQATLSKIDKIVLGKVAGDAVGRVSSLESHIFACTMLASHNVKVTPFDIQEVENDRSKVHKLFIRLSRTAGSHQPPLNKNEWTHLLRDMLQLCERVFSKTCRLEAAVCLEVYVESLLTSGMVSNFQIAGERMMRAAEEEHEMSKRRLYVAPQKLSYLTSVDQVIKASQEYFDASSPTSDDNMLGLAKECLLLITDRPESVRERLDLIEGVVLLQRFGVEKLPLQVRLTEDRLSLVQKAVLADNDAYKKTETLLRLAMLLRACGTDTDERKGQVLMIIVEEALSVADWETAYCMCQELISMPYGQGWEVCFKLACSEGFRNDKGRRDILAFVTCHCEEAKLPVAMVRMCELNSLIILRAVAAQGASDTINSEDTLGAEEESSHESDQVDALPASLRILGDGGINPLNKLMHSSAKFLTPSKVLETTTQGTKAVLSATGSVLSATSSTTKAVLSNVGNTKWWRNRIDDTLAIIPMPDANLGSPTLENRKDVSNDDFEHQGCPEFYSAIIENSISKYGLLVAKDEFVFPTETAISEARFRALQLKELDDKMVSEEEDIGDCLEHLVADIMPYDFALGLSYLCAFSDPEQAFKAFQKFPVSALSIQLGLYYFSLCFLKDRLELDESDSKSEIYSIPPMQLVKHALEVLNTTERKEDTNSKVLGSYLNQLKEQMLDFSQGEKLQELGRGIDLGRFTKDNEYRQETILGLAMTMEEDQYKLAVSLAHRSGTDVWLVLITHLEYLFTEMQEQLSCADLRSRIEALNMVPELVSKPYQFFEKMDRCVYPFIDGKDNERLVLYFSLLRECKKDEEFVSAHDMCQIQPSEHVKMLKKITSVSPNLDYKAFVTYGSGKESSKQGPERILMLLRPVLDGSNVAMFAKMVPGIKYYDFTITASALYLEVAKSIIWKDISENFSGNDHEISWIARYDSCTAYLKMCSPNDFLYFFQEVLFTSKFSKMLQVSDRQNIVKRGFKMCKTQGTKERKGQLDASILQNGQSFSTMLPILTRMMKHLDSYSTTFIANLVKNSRSDDRICRYLESYDASQSDPAKILELASIMLRDGSSPTFIQGFLAVVPGNKLNCADVMQKTIDDTVNNFSSGVETPDLLEQLSIVVKTVSDHEKAKGKIFTSEQVIRLLRPFCSDANIDARLRVNILQLLEDQFELEDSEAEMLLFHRTCAIVRDGWGENACDEYLRSDSDPANISNDDNRFKLFQSLLAHGIGDINKLKSLRILLEIWPRFEKKIMHTESWDKLLVALSKTGTDGGKEIIDIVRNIDFAFPENNVKIVFDALTHSGGTFHAIKLALLMNYPTMREDLISAMNRVTCLGPSQCDEEILKLMLDNSFAVHTVGSLYYAKISEYLLSGNCPDAERYVHSLARELQDMGHIPEAGTLLLNFRGTHTSLSTFNNALSSLKRWLNS